MNRTATIGHVIAAGTLALFVGRAAAWPLDCFTRGAVGPFTVCNGDLAFTHARPTSGGTYISGGADSVDDNTQCVADWDGDGCVTNADVAAYIASWFSSLSSGTLAADVNCDGVVTPSDVAAFMNYWSGAFASPPTGGC